MGARRTEGKRKERRRRCGWERRVTASGPSRTTIINFSLSSSEKFEIKGFRLLDDNKRLSRDPNLNLITTGHCDQIEGDGRKIRPSSTIFSFLLELHLDLRGGSLGRCVDRWNGMSHALNYDFFCFIVICLLKRLFRKERHRLKKQEDGRGEGWGEDDEEKEGTK